MRVVQIREEVAVVGWSCRFPGANSVAELWSLLIDGRCTVSQVPEDRFSLTRFGHPRHPERGKSYTWAAGVIDDVWGFDPAVFRISPREAEQMDPQQRILLQLTWEALEDAGIRPSSIAGSETGVFVGASLVEYANAAFSDPAVVDAHFGTGNSLAVLSNRISHAFDLHGPSLTIDTACSSSLVALHHAVEALRSGRIDTAIVGGINIIASHTAFVLFSQASMLSPTGLCRAFDAKADGFVRAEGGAVLILRRGALAQIEKNPIHGFVLASEVNSDGRTSGIALPSLEAQQNLLTRVYSRAPIAPSRIAFVEAHGTGTAVGDPIEATAIGRTLGRERDDPLPIGSIKSNIGHLEPASGMAGVLKALLALNHGLLPRSLHFHEPNPRIEFDQLNIEVCVQPMLIHNAGERCAGVSSFGFGGTNAHVVVGPGRVPPAAEAGQGEGARFLLISAETKTALKVLAESYAERVVASDNLGILASAAAHRRERMSHRLVVASTERAVVAEALEAFEAGTANPYLIEGSATGRALTPVFVYSGNGSQWAGMGVVAYRQSADFRAQFDQVDTHFGALAGWSLREALFSADLGDRLGLTSIAQPLIFAIQSAATAALRKRGLTPAAVLGHSVGEVAAAEAAGALDTLSAVRVIYYRSKCQESVHGSGGMAAVMATPEVCAELVDEIPGLEIAAVNSPRTVTLAGTNEAIATLKAVARARRIVLIDLGLNYPFHTSLMGVFESELAANLNDLKPRDTSIAFVSTVSGGVVAGPQLGAQYWWRNVRKPVQFMASIRETARMGVRFFVEIGPSPTLLKHITDSLSGWTTDYASLATLDRADSGVDPFDTAIAKALVAGADIDEDAVLGRDPGDVSLPHYPWQQVPFRYMPTVEGFATVDSEWHPLAGARPNGDALEWRSQIDTALLPVYADHKVGDHVILPGTAFLEIAFSVARQYLKSDAITIRNFEILKPLDLSNGETRELMTRISPGSNTLETYSRPRLAHTGWTLHSRGKMFQGSARDTELHFEAASAQQIADKAGLYDLAEASGLHYGPNFRLADRISADDQGLVSLALQPATTKSPYLLDPIRIDACMHGLITLFAELHAPQRGVAYIPVRMDEAVLFVPGGIPWKATIKTTNKDARSIVANCEIVNAEGSIIAAFRGVRCQAVPVRRTTMIESVAVLETVQPADGRLAGDTGIGSAATDILADAEVLGLLANAEALPGPAQLLEGWAISAAYEIAWGLAARGKVVPDGLVAAGRLPKELRSWLANLLRNLEAAGLAEAVRGHWSLTKDRSLPRSATIVKALAEEAPGLVSEVLLAAAVTELAATVASTKAVPEAAAALLSTSTLDFFAAAGRFSASASKALARLIERNANVLAPGRTIRVLHLGGGTSVRTLAQHAAAGRVHLTVLEPDERRLDGLRDSLSRSANIRLLGADRAGELSEYDAIVAAASLCRLPASVALADLRQALAPAGMLIAVEPYPSLFRDLVFGLDARWFADGAPELLTGRPRPAAEWELALDLAGFETSKSAAICSGDDLGLLILGGAEVPPSERRFPDVAADEPRIAVVLTAPAGGWMGRLGENFVQLAKETCDAELVGADALTSLSDDKPVVVQFVAPPAASDLTEKALVDACLAMKTLAEGIGGATVKIWLVFSGALPSEDREVDPSARGAWAFSRTLANEFAQLDIRRVDIEPGMAVDAAAARLRDIVLSATPETELQISRRSINAVRIDWIQQHRDSDGEIADNARLHGRLAGGRLLRWQSVDRAAPATDEVEVAVEATGLNFRDVMGMLSLLPEDILEDGFAGPSLGLECAGRITRIGSAVKGLQPGDRVVALAAGAFATFVTVPARQATKLPAELSCEAGATIPVAFMTAYYSLVTQAKLKRGEWVLIHGGAGGVGMAAIQIAQQRGARIIATAGSSAKRALLRALGVRHAFDSRSTEFVDAVRHITGSGVDVVLNSLAGEAMEQSIACLRPFGRFVELGKRDYVSNTHLGMRPFHKNLTYFGVDLDQLIGRGDTGQKLFFDVMRQFKSGSLTPLPHAVFDAAEVSDAFRLMQQSSHVGKILVRPPAPGEICSARRPFAINPTGTHLVTGAFGGMGLETAQWLADNGARHLVLIGRTGAITSEAVGTLAVLRERGVNVVTERCDVADEEKLTALFERMRETMPPLAGVMHLAMVLDDAIVSNLDVGRLRTVFAPKVKGADNLDRLTQGMPLDYFVLFSSVTTLVGNPGQGSYVAANAYMEGLVQRRRERGFPGLAVGWGPIIDVGVIVRDEKLRASLQRLSGALGMKAREALDFLGETLALTPRRESIAMAIAPNDGSFGGDRLAVLRSPTYHALLAGRSAAATGDTAIDLRALVANEDEETVRQKVGEIIAAQVGRVLHLRGEDISRTRPLAELGLDSLMGLELAMSFDASFGLQIALTRSADALTIAGLTDEIVAQASTGAATKPVTVVPLMERHVADVEPAQVRALTELMEPRSVRSRAQ